MSHSICRLSFAEWTLVLAACTGADLSSGVGAAGASKAGSPVIFINANLQSGSNNGTSWESAFQGRLGLQAALASLNGSPGEIWVARGVYAPALAGGNRDASIVVTGGAQLFGGFIGGETSLDQRDPVANVTIITGDLNGDDPPGDLQFGPASGPPMVGDNSRHVLRLTNVDSTTLVDGFTIERGHSDDAEGAGANVAVNGGGPVFDNCSIRHGLTWHGGGGALVRAAQPTFRHCSFIDNHGNVGGGVLHTGGSEALFEECAFLRNRGHGAGLFNGRASNADEPLVGRPVIRRCEFRSNGGGAAFGQGSGCGIFDVNGQPLIDGCLFQDNATAAGGGGLMLMRSGAMVFGCTFINNEGASDGGGAVYVTGGSFFPGDPGPPVGHPVFVNCVLNGNNGAMVCGGDGVLVDMINCTVAHNTRTPWWKTWPAFLVIQGGSLRLTNTIVWDHTPVPLEINGKLVMDTGLAGIFVRDADTQVTVDRGRVEFWDGSVMGTGTTDTDPLFVDALGDDGLPGTIDDDLRVGSGSPCIDAGDNTAMPTGVVVDIAGRARFVDIVSVPDTGIGSAPLVDIGAHERQLCDITGDGVMNVDDLLVVINAWGTTQISADLTGDGVVNVDDLLAVINAWGPCP